MLSEGVFCATFFSPIIFPPSSVLVFNYNQNGYLNFVASGNVLDINPDRIIIKRIILTGHPFKVKKRLAVVRNMFSNKGMIKKNSYIYIFINYVFYLNFL